MLGALAALGAVAMPPRAAFARLSASEADMTRSPRAYPKLFGSTETRLASSPLGLPRGRALARHLGRPAAVASAAAVEPDRGGEPKRWGAFLAGLGGVDPMSQLSRINDFVNRVAYVADPEPQGGIDHWASPAEFFRRGGDCEEFALVKFVSLYRLGYNEDRLRILLCRDKARAANHAVLVVYLDDAYLLDNQIDAVTPHGRVSHYLPIASFNTGALWLHRA